MKRSRRTLVLLAAAVGVAAASLCVAPSTLAQDVRAFARTDSVSVGERFTLVVVAERPVWARTVFVALPPDSAGEVLQIADVLLLRTLLDTSPEESESGIDSVLYEAVTFALDTAFVGSMEVGIASDGDTFRVATTPFLIPVRSVVPDDAEDILDLAPIAEFPSPVWPWILFLVLLIVATAVFLYWYRRSPRIIEVGRNDQVERASPPEEAAQRLDDLEKANLDTDDSKKLFFVELSDILRTYIWRRLGTPALESTSREVMDDLQGLARNDEAPESMINSTRHVLETSDLAKFAEMFPATEPCRETITAVRDIIETVEDFFVPDPDLEQDFVVIEEGD